MANSIQYSEVGWIQLNKIFNEFDIIQGGFFNWSAQKMSKSQPLKEFSELVLPKND